jgi:hypothetical protein
MLQIIVSSSTDERISKRKKLLGTNEEVIFIDDMNADISVLQNYAFPSLFSVSIPVVHGRYLIEQYSDQLTKELLNTLVSSPTFFLLEEKSIPTTFLKTLEKSGVIVHQEKTVKSTKEQSNIFNVTTVITSSSKKDRWLSYQRAVEEHAIEAVMGILYWKLRSLIEISPKNKTYKDMYSAFMEAHKKSWQKGFPLELAIEKAILSN